MPAQKISLILDKIPKWNSFTIGTIVMVKFSDAGTRLDGKVVSRDSATKRVTVKALFHKYQEKFDYRDVRIQGNINRLYRIITKMRGR